MTYNELATESQHIITLLRHVGHTLVTAESCTGGLISAIITETPGASDIFERGFVTYSNQSKIDLLTVPTFYIEDFGAVSRETAIAMAEGALLLSKASISLAVTGIAGPDGGTALKPVGTVYIASTLRHQKTCLHAFLFKGDRASIRFQAAKAAFDVLHKQLSHSS